MLNLETFGDMGFSQEQVQRALNATNNIGIESALEWLLDHADDQPVAAAEISITPIKESKAYGETADSSSAHLQQNTVKKNYTNTRIKVGLLDGKILTDTFDVSDQLSAVRLWVQSKQGNEKHFNLMTNFPKKVFTDEDNIKSLERLDLIPSAVLIVEQVFESEILPIVLSDVSNFEEKVEKKKLQEHQQQRKQEIQEERLLRNQVLAQIEDDKATRRARQELKTCKVQMSPQTTSVQALPARQSTAKNSCTNTRIQVRLTDGSTLTETFNVSEPLAVIRLWVQSKRKNYSQINLMTDFPRRLFCEEDYQKSFSDLNSVPSALLIVPQDRAPEKMRIETGEEENEAKLQMEQIKLQKMLEEKKRELEEDRLAREKVLAQIEDDKAARNARWGSLPATPSKAAALPEPVKIHSLQKEDADTKIQVRMRDGTTFTKTFSVHERFSAVRFWVRSNCGINHFTLMTSFPKKKFVEGFGLSAYGNAYLFYTMDNQPEYIILSLHFSLNKNLVLSSFGCLVY